MIKFVKIVEEIKQLCYAIIIYNPLYAMYIDLGALVYSVHIANGNGFLRSDR